MPGRSHKPLFEHLAKDREESLPPVDLPRPSAPTREPREPRPASTPPSPGRLTLSYAAIYGFIAAALALAVATWTIGYRLGYGAGEKSAWQTDADPIDLPPPGDLGNPEDNTPAPGSGSSTGSRPINNGAGQPPRTGAPATTAGILAAEGTLYADPRQPGSNYLELATLTRDQAESAIQFLASRGVPAIGVPVDSGPGGANNPARYRLVSMKLGIPGEQFRDSAARRRAHEDEIRRLGVEWQTDGGASNFAKPQWTRFP